MTAPGTRAAGPVGCQPRSVAYSRREAPPTWNPSASTVRELLAPVPCRDDSSGSRPEAVFLPTGGVGRPPACA